MPKKNSPGCGCCGGRCVTCATPLIDEPFYLQFAGLANRSLVVPNEGADCPTCDRCDAFNACSIPLVYDFSDSYVQAGGTGTIWMCFWKSVSTYEVVCPTRGTNHSIRFRLFVSYNDQSNVTTIIVRTFAHHIIGYDCGTFYLETHSDIVFFETVLGKLNCTDLCDRVLPPSAEDLICNHTGATCTIKCGTPETECETFVDDPPTDPGTGEWVCVDGEWVLVGSACEEGQEPCRPPAEDCDVENEVVTTDCVEIGTCPEPDPAGGTADWLCVDGEWMLTGETCTGDGQPCPPPGPCTDDDTATTDCEFPEDCGAGGACDGVVGYTCHNPGTWETLNACPGGDCVSDSPDNLDCTEETDGETWYTPCYDPDDFPGGLNGCAGYACAWIGNAGGGWDRIDNTAVVCVAPCQCQPPARGAMMGELSFTDCFGSA